VDKRKYLVIVDPSHEESLALERMLEIVRQERKWDLEFHLLIGFESPDKTEPNAPTETVRSFKELEALQKGGVQRIYTGNMTTGEHQLNVTIMGKLKSGKDFSESDSFVFSKGIEPKALGLTLSGPGIQVGSW